jgi:hypothetical protein
MSIAQPTVFSAAILFRFGVAGKSAIGAAIVAGINEDHSLSEHVKPLRSVHANCTSCATREIKCHPARKWAAVINDHGNRGPVLRVRHQDGATDCQNGFRRRHGLARADERCSRRGACASGVTASTCNSPVLAHRGPKLTQVEPSFHPTFMRSRR